MSRGRVSHLAYVCAGVLTILTLLRQISVNLIDEDIFIGPVAVSKHYIMACEKAPECFKANY